VRYRLLETLREYAGERLDAAGETERARQAHLAWCLALAAQVSKVPVVGHARVVAIERVVADMANVRAALSWCLEHDVASGLRLAGDLFWLWYSRHRVEGCRWLLALTNHHAQPNPERSRGLGYASWLVASCGDIPRGKALAEESLDVNPTSLTDRVSASVACWQLAVAYWVSAEPTKARQLFEESLITCHEIAELWGVAQANWQLGTLDQHEGNRTQAHARLAEALACFRETGSESLVGQLLMMQGDLARVEGRYQQARELLEESVRLCRADGNKEGVSWSLGILGDVARAEGDYTLAEELCAESLAYYDDFGVKPSWSRVLGCLANLARLQAHWDQARARLKDALIVMREVGNAKRIAEGLCFAGMTAVQEGDFQRGTRLLGGASAFGPMLRTEFDPNELADLDASINAARTALGEEAFDRAHADGQALSFDQALELALA
jgi:tetratricopeptide (TPR) repeat protein